MAVTFGTPKDSAGVMTNLGQDGFTIVRLVLDGSVTSKAVTLNSNHPIKTIMGAVGGTSNNIPVAGVAATTGFTVKFAAGTNAEFLDVLVWGLGR